MSGKYYFVFIVMSFVVSVCISLGFVGSKVDDSVLDMMDDHANTISSLAVSHLGQHVSNRVKVANDIAQQPIVVGGVMGTSASSSYLNDYMNELSVLGVKEEFIILDILGDELFSSFSGATLMSVDKTPWFESLINNQTMSAVFLIKGEGESRLAVAVPSRYNGLAEGVLVVIFSEPFDAFIKTLVSNEQMFGIQLRGPYMDYQSIDGLDSFELLHQTSIDLTNLTLDYLVNQQALSQNKKEILLSIAISVLTGLLVSFGILWPLGRHYLLEPFQKLELSEAKTKAALKELENLKHAVDQHNSVAITDLDGDITYANQKLSEIAGYSVDELLGKNQVLFRSEHHDQTFFDSRYRSILAGDVWHGEVCKRFRNGDLKWLDTTIVPLTDDLDKVESFAEISSDITELKRVQRELAASHERSRLATNAAQIGIWEWDVESNELAWDDWMYELYGVPRDSVEDAFEAWKITAHPDDQVDLAKFLIRILKYDTVSESEFRILRPDGQVRTLQVKLQVTRNDAGRATRIIGVNYDITERVESTKLLEQARIEAEQGAIAKGEFLANMSHEIRTPMNGVIGMLQLVESTDLSNDQSEKIHIALSSAQSLLSLINDILDFSKIEAGKLDIEDIPFNLGTVLENTLKSLEHTIADEHDVLLKFDLNTIATTVVKGDPGRIRQIVTNLLSNAIKFTKQGEIKLRSELIDEAEGSWRFRCSIADTGIGIPEEKLNILFEEFSQVDASTTRQYGGTGLGLSITKRLCDLMGGSISVESVLGEGSCFSFDIRLGKVSVSEQEALGSRESTNSHVISLEPVTPELKLDEGKEETELSNLSHNTVLLVEDNNVNKLVATSLLSNLGLSFDCAENGVEALDILASENHSKKYALVLMDCQMPEMDGYETTRRLRSGSAGSYYQSIPIIAMTANAMEGDRERCLAAGMDDYISKPIDPKILQETLHKWLNSSRNKA